MNANVGITGIGSPPQVTVPLTAVPAGFPLFTTGVKLAVNRVASDGIDNIAMFVPGMLGHHDANAHFLEAIATGVTIVAMNVNVIASSTVTGLGSSTASFSAGTATLGQAQTTYHESSAIKLPVSVSMENGHIPPGLQGTRLDEPFPNDAANANHFTRNNPGTIDGSLHSAMQNNFLFNGLVNSDTNSLEFTVPHCSLRMQLDHNDLANAYGPILRVQMPARADNTQTGATVVFGASIDLVYYKGYAQTQKYNVKLKDDGEWSVDTSRTNPNAFETVLDGLYWPVPWEHRISSRFTLWRFPKMRQDMRKGKVAMKAFSKTDSLVLFDDKYSGLPANPASSLEIKKKPKKKVSKKKKKSRRS